MKQMVTNFLLHLVRLYFSWYVSESDSIRIHRQAAQPFVNVTGQMPACSPGIWYKLIVTHWIKLTYVRKTKLDNINYIISPGCQVLRCGLVFK